jgi:hypothetical protein
MRLATFLPPDSSTPRAGIVREDRVVAVADERLTVLELLGEPAPAVA